MITVVPARHIWSTSSMTSWDICGSRPAVGSSRMRTFGSMARAPAMATLFFCPYESCVVGRYL